MVSDSVVKVTKENDIYVLIDEALHKNSNCVETLTADVYTTTSEDFNSSFTDNYCLCISKHVVNLYINRLLPTKMLDYVDPESSSLYLGL